MKKIQNAYDKEEFYVQYKKMREEKANANELLEIPLMKELLNDLENKSIIKL